MLTFLTTLKLTKHSPFKNGITTDFISFWHSDLLKNKVYSNAVKCDFIIIINKDFYLC